MLVSDDRATPRGSRVGDTVVYRGQQYVIKHIVDGGLRVDIGVGWAINWHMVTT